MYMPDDSTLFAYIYPWYSFPGKEFIDSPVILGRIRHHKAVFLPEGYDGYFGFSTAYKGKSNAF